MIAAGRRNRARLGPMGLGVALGDLLLVHGSYLAAFVLRFAGTFPAPNFEAYLRAAPALSGLALVLFVLYGLYDLRPRTWRNAASGLLVAVTLQCGLGMGFSFVLRAFALPRTVFLLAWLLQLVFLLAWRNAVWNLTRKRWGAERVLVVGPRREAEAYAGKVAARGSSGYEVAGIVVGQEPEENAPWLAETAAAGEASSPKSGPIGLAPEPAGGVPAHALTELPAILDSGPGAPDLLVVTPSTTTGEKAHVVALACSCGIPVLLIPSHHDLLVLDAGVTQIGGNLAFEVGGAGIPSEVAWAKRLTDIGLALVGLALTLPFYPFIALAIKLDSPGPVFYRQTRAGLGGRPYTLWKFRTMRRDAEAASGAVLAQRDDPRVTRVGRSLRRYRLDELPQLLNVLGGSMSLVGPRPERPEFVEEYSRRVPFYTQRHLVKPGLTGLAQLSGRYDTPVEEKLRYDLLYAKRYSFLMDIRILFLTAKVLLLGEEAHWWEE